jgi:hypothetical protein
MLSRKRKYEDENRGLKIEWEEEFVFVGRHGGPMCILCQITLSQFKASNLKCHHNAFGQQFPAGSMLRRTTVLSLKQNFITKTRLCQCLLKRQM